MCANVDVFGQIWMANKREISHPDVDASKSKIGWMWCAYFRWVHKVIAMAILWWVDGQNLKKAKNSGAVYVQAQ